MYGGNGNTTEPFQHAAPGRTFSSGERRRRARLESSSGRTTHGWPSSSATDDFGAGPRPGLAVLQLIGFAGLQSVPRVLVSSSSNAGYWICCARNSPLPTGLAYGCGSRPGRAGTTRELLSTQRMPTARSNSGKSRLVVIGSTRRRGRSNQSIGKSTRLARAVLEADQLTPGSL